MRAMWMATALFVCLFQGCVGDPSEGRSGALPGAPDQPTPTNSNGDPDVPCVPDPNGNCTAGGTSIGSPAGTCTSTEIFNATFSGENFWTCQSNNRYICDDHQHKIVEVCINGCSPRSTGIDDECAHGSAVQCTATEFTNQNLNGASLWTCQGNARYVCDGASAPHYKVTEPCPNGCIGEGAGHDDQCR